MTVKALIFDFDGLILDTELPSFEAWQTIYQRYGCELPFSEWQKCFGASKAEFNPVKHLEQLVGFSLDEKKVRHAKRVISLSKIAELPPLPGVENLIKTAFSEGFKLAVASGGTTDWVWIHLARLGLLKYFETICCRDDVSAVKPDPELYNLALSELKITPAEAIAFEDSPNGILAAQKAGLFCVAVPNAISWQMKVDFADLVVPAMTEIELSSLLQKHAQASLQR